MTRPLDADRLVVASHNPGKVREIGDLLGPCGLTVLSAGDLGLSEPEETGTTFAENAAIKALASARGGNLPALADDSGLTVRALNGAPGLYSARWAGPDKDFRAAMERVNNEMGDAADRGAAFVCVLCLAWPDGHTETFEGRVEGTIIWPPRGDKGFGYDPIFQPHGHTITFGEMDPDAKHAMSHRADAFNKLVNACLAHRAS